MSGNGAPKALASLGLKPQPRPRIRRPPLIVSRVDAILAVMAGLRNVELTTPNPMSTRGTAAATAVWRVRQSKTISSGSHLERVCSPAHRASKPRRSPSCAIWRMRSHAATGCQPSNSLK